jgi:hypothetical protein
MSWQAFEAFGDEQQFILEAIGEGTFLLEDEAADERPLATLRLDAPVPLSGIGPLAGGTLDVRMRLLGLIPSDDPDDDADGFGIMEQEVIVSGGDGAVLLVWRFGPNTGSLEISGSLRGGAKLDSVLLPTGYVPLEEIIRALIEGFGVPPQVEDWDGRLTAFDEEDEEDGA